MVRTSWAITILTILLFAFRADAQGRLQSVRDDVRPSTDSKSSSSSSDSDYDSGWSSSSYSSEGSGGGAGGSRDCFLGIAVLAPFLIPMAILKDDYSLALDFAPHPYANSYRGYQLLPVVYADLFCNKDFKGVPRKEWALRVAVENGNDFAGMNRLNGQLKLEHANRWGIVTNWNYFRESLANGRSDETVIGDANLTFRFAQNEMTSMYTGLGLRVLTDRQQTDFGINFTYGGDWFPVRPIVVSGVFDAGTLGSAGVVHARGTVGAICGGFEVFTGYDFLRIGRSNLQGPMVGVRLWF